MVHRWMLPMLVWLLCFLPGCGAREQASPVESPRAAAHARVEAPRAHYEAPAAKAAKAAAADEAPRSPPMPVQETLADLMPPQDARKPVRTPPPQIDETRLSAAGIRKLARKRLALYTDLPQDAEIDALPEVFDQAFPQWCAYFGIDPAEHADWRMTGVLMKDKEKFLRTGLLPADLAPFPHAYSREGVFWMYEQESVYYRRHLVLHEGTHGFCESILGACGPPWYMEGVAELLATHRWKDGRLEMNIMPADKDETPMWGRIKIIRDALAAGRAMDLAAVLAYGPIGDTEPYAWCWAAAYLLDHDPRFGPRFRQLPRLVREADFNRLFLGLIGGDWDLLDAQWQVFIHDLEYGYDVSRTALDITPGKPLSEPGATATVAADRGWQNSGWGLKAGTTYRLRANGRYQVADRPQIWWCEPNGVSIRYYQGRPLGVLLYAVRPDRGSTGETATLVRPEPAGLEAILTPQESGTLFLRINDSGGELADNAGTLSVEVRPQERSRGDLSP